MNEKTIKSLIDKSKVLGFYFDSNEMGVTWEVTPGAGKMLARRKTDYNDGTSEAKYFAVPYDDLDAVDGLYNDIVIDFVNFYFEDLSNGDGGKLCLFTDIAAPYDNGLRQMLSFFDKIYGEFINDVFFWFGVCAEAETTKDEGGEVAFGEPMSAKDRLVAKVLNRLGDYMLDMQNDENGLGYNWLFAKANGDIWYSFADYGCGESGYYAGDPEFGHVKMDDEVAMALLRELITAELELCDWNYEDSGGCLSLLGIGEL